MMVECPVCGYGNIDIHVTANMNVVDGEVKDSYLYGGQVSIICADCNREYKPYNLEPENIQVDVTLKQ